MDSSDPEWDNQPDFCFVCMSKKDAEGNCKCPPSPSLEETLRQMTSTDEDRED